MVIYNITVILKLEEPPSMAEMCNSVFSEVYNTCLYHILNCVFCVRAFCLNSFPAFIHFCFVFLVSVAARL